MQTLSPAQTAEMANRVYQLRTQSLDKLHHRQLPLGCEGMFTVDGDGVFTGSSGAGPWKHLSGFGYIAAGEGAFSGEVLIVTRGTSTTADWLSNLNIGMQIGPGGLPVHAGFHEIWKSFRHDIAAFLKGRNPTHIHCVGHSLGGALATLNADHITAHKIAGVSLYTFGAPRVGDVFFSRALTQRIGGQRVFRVAASSDPVPMIPVFPFCHLPFDRGACVLHRKGLVSATAHSIRDSYLAGVGTHSWAALQAAGDANEDGNVKSWLENAADGKGSMLMGSATVLTMIGRALAWLLGRVRDALVGTLGIVLAGAATVLDQLAWLLAKGAAATAEIARGVAGLINTIFRFLGRRAVQTGKVTVAFVRWVLELLFNALRAAAQRALHFI